MARVELREPWQSFLLALDDRLTEPVELHCLGGFVISELYGLTRGTADIDVLPGSPDDAATIALLAGRSSALAKRHRVYIDVVTVAQVPENYTGRLIDYEVKGLKRLRLRALERYDLALAKLTRNSDRDREDVKALAAGPGLDPGVLRGRYETELRPYLGRPDREDLTLELWVEIIREIHAS